MGVAAEWGSGRSQCFLASIELSLPHRPATDMPHARPAVAPARAQKKAVKAVKAAPGHLPAAARPPRSRLGKGGKGGEGGRGFRRGLPDDFAEPAEKRW